MDTVKEGIRRTLAQLIAESGKRNVDLAEACHVGKSAVSNWLSGKNSIDIELMPVICDFFGVTMDEFFGRSKTMEPSPMLTPDEKVDEYDDTERAIIDAYRNGDFLDRALIERAAGVNGHAR